MAKKKMGRPIADIDWELLDKIACFNLKQADIAWIMGVALDTLAKAIRSRFDETFSEFQDKRRSRIRLMLHQKQFEVAMKGNVSMLIWLGKQELDQTEKTYNVNQEKLPDEIFIGWADEEDHEDKVQTQDSAPKTN